MGSKPSFANCFQNDSEQDHEAPLALFLQTSNGDNERTTTSQRVVCISSFLNSYPLLNSDLTSVPCIKVMFSVLPSTSLLPNLMFHFMEPTTSDPADQSLLLDSPSSLCLMTFTVRFSLLPSQPLCWPT